MYSCLALSYSSSLCLFTVSLIYFSYVSFSQILPYMPFVFIYLFLFHFSFLLILPYICLPYLLFFNFLFSLILPLMPHVFPFIFFWGGVPSLAYVLSCSFFVLFVLLLPMAFCFLLFHVLSFSHIPLVRYHSFVSFPHFSIHSLSCYFFLLFVCILSVTFIHLHFHFLSFYHMPYVTVPLSSSLPLVSPLAVIAVVYSVTSRGTDC